jgi:hypothetical protein
LCHRGHERRLLPSTCEGKTRTGLREYLFGQQPAHRHLLTHRALSLGRHPRRHRGSRLPPGQDPDLAASMQNKG